MPQLTGETVLLRPLEREDYTVRNMAWLQDPVVTHYLVRGTFPSTQVEQDKAFEAHLASTSDIEMAIVDSGDGTTIGIAGLHRLDWVARQAEFRIMLGETTYWGRGAGRETLQLMVTYAFRTLNLNKVWLGVNAENERAVRAYQRAGFSREGLLRDEVYSQGHYADVIRMSLLSRDFEGVLATWSSPPSRGPSDA